MKIKNPFTYLTKFEWGLWLFSLAVICISFFAFSNKDYMALVSATVGVTTLIFCAKGMLFGQIISVFFAIFYAMVSFSRGYYGEMITYLGMNTPMAIFSIVIWARNPYKDSVNVKVKDMNKSQTAVMFGLAAVITVVFYFILKALGTNQLAVSTLSIATSFIPAYMMAMRSPLYALGFIANDIILIILWILSAISDVSSVPMVACFIMFLVNDLYALINWRKMKSAQAK